MTDPGGEQSREIATGYELWRERRALWRLVWWCGGALALGVAVQLNLRFDWLPTAVYGVRDFAVEMGPLAPFSTAFVALVASVIAYFTLRHRRQADSKTEWWKRVQFAIELATDEQDETKQDTGLWLIDRLQADYRSATPADAALLADIADQWGNEIAETGEDAYDALASGGEPPEASIENSNADQGADEADQLLDSEDSGKHEAREENLSETRRTFLPISQEYFLAFGRRIRPRREDER